MFGLITRYKAKKRLKVWEQLRAERIKKEEEKRAIRLKLLERYDLRETISSTFLSYRGDDELWCTHDEFGNYQLEEGNIVPYCRRGELVFYYKITNTWRKYGDYGFSDYGYFMSLEYSHSEKIPHKEVDFNKSGKLKWEIVERDGEKIRFGLLQGIKVLRIEKQTYKDGFEYKIDYLYRCFNRRAQNSLPNYGDIRPRLNDARKKAQERIDEIMADDMCEIQMDYLPHKIARRNREK